MKRNFYKIIAKFSEDSSKISQTFPHNFHEIWIGIQNFAKTSLQIELLQTEAKHGAFWC